MGTVSYGARTLVHDQVEPAKSASSVWSHLKSDSGAKLSFFFKFVFGLVLAVSFVLCIEVAVCATVQAAFGIVSRVYHESILPRVYPDESAMASGDEPDRSSTSASKRSSEERRPSPSPTQQLAVHKTTMDCMSNPHRCN
jgi:hypothetical protein